mgnify:CR=1 FL=1
MSFKRGKRETVYNNREHFLSSNSLNINELVSAELVHGSKIAVVSKTKKKRDSDANDWIQGVDGLVTSEAGILLSTTHADCLPIVLYDSKLRVIGQAHCGWRGLHAGIILELVSTFRHQRNSDIKEVRSWIGPSIGVECYEVSRSVADLFPSHFNSNIADKIHLDLVGFARSELVNLGITAENIVLSNICTSCDSSFSSFRRDGDEFNAMLLATGLK